MDANRPEPAEGMGRFLSWLEAEIERHKDMEQSMDKAGRAVSYLEYRVRWTTYDTVRAMFKNWCEVTDDQ